MKKMWPMRKQVLKSSQSCTRVYLFTFWKLRKTEEVRGDSDCQALDAFLNLI